MVLFLIYLQRYFSLPAKAHILSLFLFPVSTNYVMKMINCFIPFLSLPQARQTVRALGLCDRIKNIYLLATEKIPDEVEGCEMMMIDSPRYGLYIVIYQIYGIRAGAVRLRTPVGYCRRYECRNALCGSLPVKKRQQPTGSCHRLSERKLA